MPSSEAGRGASIPVEETEFQAVGTEGPAVSQLSGCTWRPFTHDSAPLGNISASSQSPFSEKLKFLVGQHQDSNTSLSLKIFKSRHSSFPKTFSQHIYTIICKLMQGLIGNELSAYILWIQNLCDMHSLFSEQQFQKHNLHTCSGLFKKIPEVLSRPFKNAFDFLSVVIIIILQKFSR